MCSNNHLDDIGKRAKLNKYYNIFQFYVYIGLKLLKDLPSCPNYVACCYIHW